MGDSRVEDARAEELREALNAAAAMTGAVGALVWANDNVPQEFLRAAYVYREQAPRPETLARWTVGEHALVQVLADLYETIRTPQITQVMKDQYLPRLLYQRGTFPVVLDPWGLKNRG